MRVAEKRQLANGVVGLGLVAADGSRVRDWTPGSHIDLHLPNGMTRQYSLCGDRWAPNAYHVAVLRVPTSLGGSSYIHDQLAVGDLVEVGGPRNNFRMVPSRRYLFVAGGIGITPLKPMIDQAVRQGVDWTLIYGGRHRSSMAFVDELASLGSRVEIAPEDEVGPIDVQHVMANPDPETKVYACGPAGLLEAVANQSAAWPTHAVRTERFVADEARNGGVRRDFQIHLARRRQTLSVPAGASVLQVLLDAGIQVLSSCQRGVCGTCETPVLLGRPDHRDSVLSEADRSTGECMLPCVSRSLDDLLVLDL